MSVTAIAGYLSISFQISEIMSGNLAMNEITEFQNSTTCMHTDMYIHTYEAHARYST